MHLLYVLLIVGGALGHYHGSYDSRNLVERDEPENDIDRELVECPVCEDSSSWTAIHEECPIDHRGKRYKLCEHGAYINKACGNRPDCYRGPGEKCTEKMTIDLYDQRCMPGYYCNPVERRCTGAEYSVDSNRQRLLISPYLPFTNHSRIRALNFQYPIRARRDV